MAPVVEVWGDLFAMPTASAHAVSVDLLLGPGVAVGFKEENKLLQGKRVGEVAFLKHNTSYIFYLITKERYSDKRISLDTVLSCLVNLKMLCISLGVREVSMPRVCCGTDLLKYEDVLPLIRTAFCDCIVKVNIVTPPPTFNGMSVLGDSQGLRLLLNRGKLPAGFKTKPFPRSAGFSVSGLTVNGLLKALDKVPNNSLGDALVFIGTNDLLTLAARESGHEAGLVKVKQNLSTLRTVLSKKCKSFARAVVTTVPPLPKLLAPKGGDEDYRHLWTTFNDELLQLSSPRFFVLDVQEFFMKDGLLQEDLFESFMGHGAKRRKDRLHINHNGMNAIEEALRTVPPFQRTAKNNL